MAKRAPAAKQPAAKKRQAASPANELEVLHPDASVRIRDRLLQVREYGYIEGLQLQAGIKPLLDALHAMFQGAAAPPGVPQVREVLALHASTLQWLMAQAITPRPDDPAGLETFAQEIAKNAQWVDTLDDVQGDALMAVWWGVNASFFSRRLRERLLADRAARATSSHQEGSTQP